MTEALVIGRQTPLRPNFYLPPRSKKFKAWIVMQYEMPNLVSENQK